MYKTLTTMLFFIFSSFIFSQDVSLSLDGNNLNYASSSDIAGFQFDHTGCVTDASGGDAAANGFMISVGGSTVLGFSLTGAVIPSGSGTLVVLDGEPSQECINNFIFAGAGGIQLEVDWDENDDPCDDPVMQDCWFGSLFRQMGFQAVIYPLTPVVPAVV